MIPGAFDFRHHRGLHAGVTRLVRFLVDENPTVGQRAGFLRSHAAGRSRDQRQTNRQTTRGGRKTGCKNCRWRLVIQVNSFVLFYSDWNICHPIDTRK